LAFGLGLHEVFKGTHFVVKTVEDAIFVKVVVTIKVPNFVFEIVLATFMFSLKLKLSLYI